MRPQDRIPTDSADSSVMDGWVSTLCGLHLAPWFCSVKAGRVAGVGTGGFLTEELSLPSWCYPAIMQLLEAAPGPGRRVGSSFLFTAAGAALDGSLLPSGAHAAAGWLWGAAPAVTWWGCPDGPWQPPPPPSLPAPRLGAPDSVGGG